MELPNGNECTTKPKRCCRKLANPSMVDTRPNTASLCQKFVGLKSRLFSMTNLQWKTTLKLQQERQELETRKIGYSRWKKERCSRTNESTTGFRWSKPRNEKTARWTCERDFKRKYTHSSCTTIKTTKGPTIWRTWWIWLSNRCPNRMENLSFEVNLSRNPTHSSSSTQWEQHDDWKSKTNLEFLAMHWTVVIFFEFRDAFSLAGKRIPWQSTGGVCRYPCRTPHFTCTVIAQITQHRWHLCTARGACEGSSLSCVPK